MDSKPQVIPAKAKTADAIFAPPPVMVEVTVRANNLYGASGPGERVKVTEREYERCKHALVTDADAAIEAAAAKAAATPPDDAAMFRAFRGRNRAAAAQRLIAEGARERLRLERLGIKLA